MQNNSSSVSSGNSEPLLGRLNTELEKIAKKAGFGNTYLAPLKSRT